MSAKTAKAPDPTWLGKEEVQRRAVDVREAWDNWVDGNARIPTPKGVGTVDLIDSLEGLLTACGAPYNAPEDG